MKQSTPGPIAGFTLIELAVVTVIIGVLASIAAPSVQKVRERAVVAQAIGDLKALEIELDQYYTIQLVPPPNLAAIDRAGMLDPWGNPYVYTAIAGTGGTGVRLDKFSVAINIDYDLYSMGKDGASSPSITATESRDDIIRANDGAYTGVAESF